MHPIAPKLMHPISPVEQLLIRDEFARVLKSRHFSNSRRYPALLSYIVEKTLAGHTEELKERVLGVEVFHRRSNYDSDIDTVVRVAAGEVRRRLVQIYHESDGEHVIEISLPIGSYVPEFHRNTAAEALVSFLPAEPELRHPIAPAAVPEPLPALVLDYHRPGWRKIVPGLALILLTASLVMLFLHRRDARQSAIDLFWQPIRSSLSPAILSPGALVQDPNSRYGLTMAQRTDDYTFTSMATTMALTDLVRLFSR